MFRLVAKEILLMAFFIYVINYISQVETNNGTLNSHVESSHVNNDNDFDERFIKSYIGDKADKMYDSIKNGGINIWAILLGVAYFGYRKMYLFVGISAILIGIINGLLSPTIGLIVEAVIGFLFCVWCWISYLANL